MATDAVYTAELIDAALADLRAHLPSGWITAGTAGALKLLECGDLADYVGPEGLVIDTPAIIIRPRATITPDLTNSGIGGREMSSEPFRLVHVRAWEDCYTEAGAREDNMTRARAAYAKAIHQALFADDLGRLGSPTLTCADGSATVEWVQWDGWDVGGGSTEDVAGIRNLGLHLWAIACDYTVQVLAG